jgi:tRNA1(Val) A37 N6-methylase TrmN6
MLVSNSTSADPTLTRDSLLGGKIILWQPARGYRVAIDPVLLAAAVEPRAGARVLDLGCGVGAISLCLLARCPGISVIGLELNAALVDIARRNASNNDPCDRLAIHQGSVIAPPPEIPAAGFDLVVTNPPYLEAGRATASPEPAKQSADLETSADLQAWIETAARALKNKGRLAMIHRADRLDHVLALLRGGFGEIIIHPLWPKAGAPAKRVIIHARKGVATPTQLRPGTVLHQENGAYTADAREALAGGRLRTSS